MRFTFVAAAAALIAVGLATSAFAGPAEDAAYDKNKGAVIDMRGNCVRTKWQDASDPCAAPAPEPRRIVRPAPRPVPQVSREARTLYFDFNKAALTEESTRKLDELADVINGSSAITNVTIHGFTDQIGSDSYNATLAQKRVDAAKAYLDGKSRLKAEGDIRGIGKATPEAECATLKNRAKKIACMSKERRVEIEFNAQK